MYLLYNFVPAVGKISDKNISWWVLLKKMVRLNLLTAFYNLCRRGSFVSPISKQPTRFCLEGQLNVLMTPHESPSPAFPSVQGP